MGTASHAITPGCEWRRREQRWAAHALTSRTRKQASWNISPDLRPSHVGTNDRPGEKSPKTAIAVTMNTVSHPKTNTSETKQTRTPCAFFFHNASFILPHKLTTEQLLRVTPRAAPSSWRRGETKALLICQMNRWLIKNTVKRL